MTIINWMINDIVIELKEMLKENKKITVMLTYDGKNVNTMHIMRKYDK